MYKYLEDKNRLKGLIDVAAGRKEADLLIRNCRVVNVYTGEIIDADIAIHEGRIAAVGTGYKALEEFDAQGLYASPSFIDAHIHVESSCTTPEELGRMLVPHGTGTIIADPHEIVNVSGIDGLRYMQAAARRTVLDIRYMMPSCVPATPFEHAGASLDAAAMTPPMEDEAVQGMGEFMNFPGVVHADDQVLDKLCLAHRTDKVIDGHSPALVGKDLNAYIAAGIKTDHECSTPEEMMERLRNGVYVQMRMGSACHDLPRLIKGVTPYNYRRCLLCSDDRQAKTILEQGHLEEHLRICVRAGLSPVQAIAMATLNTAECYGLKDRGALSPGLRADIVLLEDLRNFKVRRCYLNGKEVARDGEYLLPVEREPIDLVANSMHVRDFSLDKLKMHLKSKRVRVIEILPGGVVTGQSVAEVNLDDSGDFIRDPQADIVKMAVVERHQNTGNVSTALLGGYGMRRGAVALSIAHDSHNIITVGVSNEEMYAAVQALIAQKGGMVLVENGDLIGSLPMPVGGIMSDRDGSWVSQTLDELHALAHERLGISADVEPLMTLCFMSLAVIPELKLTDEGLFDVGKFDFVPVEAE